MNVGHLVRRSPILDASGRPLAVDRRPADERLSEMNRTGIDASATNRHNANHFADAKGRPLGAVLHDDLPIVRDRLRYETLNNGDGKGMVDTLANAVVAMGPTLQVNSGNPDLDTFIEEQFALFAEDCDYQEPDTSIGDELYFQMREQCIAGEDFFSPTTDPDYPGPIKLRLQLVAPERVSTPWDQLGNYRIRDGVEFNDRGKKLRYWVNRCHPQDFNLVNLASFYIWDPIDVSQMFHSYLRIEAVQHRGFPWFTPALDEMAATRRFAAAVLSAAETAADLSFVLETDTDLISQLGEDAVRQLRLYPAMDTIQAEKDSGMVLPAGYKAHQFAATQPNAEYEPFMRERRRSMGRPLGMPYNIAAADSKDYNFASGRLDHQMFYLMVLTLRQWKSRKVLRPVFKMWLNEARLALPELSGLDPMTTARIARTSEWYFKNPVVHGDPQKEANSITLALANGSTTYIDVCAEKGIDWRTQLAKQAKVNVEKLRIAAEMKKVAEGLGLAPEEAAAAIDPAKPVAIVHDPALEGEIPSGGNSEPDNKNAPKRKPAKSIAA